MNDPNVFINPCAICKRKSATRLCDFVVNYIKTSLDFRVTTVTCDLPMCDDCTKQYYPVDFCPHHESLWLKRELPEKLKRFAIQHLKSK